MGFRHILISLNQVLIVKTMHMLVWLHSWLVMSWSDVYLLFIESSKHNLKRYFLVHLLSDLLCPGYPGKALVLSMSFSFIVEGNGVFTYSH